MSLKTKIYAGFGTFVLVLLIMLVSVFNIVTKSTDELYELVEDRYDSTRLMMSFREDIDRIGLTLREFSLGYTSELEATERIADLENKTSAVMRSINLIAQGKKASGLLIAVQVQSAEVYKKKDRVLAAKREGEDQAIAAALRQETSSHEQLHVLINEYMDQLDADIAEMIRDTERKLLGMRILLLIIYTILALIASSFIISYVRKLFDNIERSVVVMNNMALGSAESIERIQVDSHDELSAIAKAYNRLADTLERHIRHERAYQKEIEEQNWLKTTIADITTMYQGVQDIGSLARRLLSKLAPPIGASYGAFYMVDESEGRRVLRKLAAYAENESPNAKDSFEFGEGLVGQCASERKTIYLEHLPRAEIRIRSAMLDVEPSQLILVPVEYEDRVLGVAEFATLSVFLPLHQLLLQQVLSNAGITFRSVQDHMRVQLLLSDSQALTEELQTQSEEMHQQQEELMRINEKLEEQYRSAELRSLELHSIKAELEEKARLLEQSSRYKTEFLANMSHELRTPLNSLLILAQILQDNEDGRLTPKQVEYAGAIYASGQQLLQLINDILDLSKAESGKIQIRKEPVRVAELLEFAERMFMPMAREKDIEFIIEQGDGVPEQIYSDPQRLHQIMNNLLANAFKFTDRGGVTLRISGYGETLVNGAYDWIAIDVSDTGIGIPEDKQSVIFEAFQQADGTTSRKYGGSGLGLSISRNIAELLGGSIQVSSREGYGSVFTFYLPLDDSSLHRPPAMNVFPEAAAAVEDKEESAEGEQEELELQGHTILVIDDDIRNVFAVTAVLESNKLNVVFAENGRDGVEMLRMHPDIDLVLMDIMMPEMDGLEAIRLIRTIPDYRDLPIIALTAKAMKTDRELCIQAGASDYISKPVQPEQLVSLLRVWLYRSRGE